MQYDYSPNEKNCYTGNAISPVKTDCKGWNSYQKVNCGVHDKSKCLENDGTGQYDKDCCGLKTAPAKCTDGFVLTWGDVCYQTADWTAYTMKCTPKVNTYTIDINTGDNTNTDNKNTDNTNTDSGGGGGTTDVKDNSGVTETSGDCMNLLVMDHRDESLHCEFNVRKGTIWYGPYIKTVMLNSTEGAICTDLPRCAVVAADANGLLSISQLLFAMVFSVYYFAM